MSTKKILLTLFTIILIVQAACDTFNSVGETRGGVYLTVDQITWEIGAGALAVIDLQTGTITVNSDQASVYLSNRPKNASITDSPWLDIILEEYQVTFYRIDGGTAVPNSVRRKLTYNVEFSKQLKIEKLDLLSAEQKLEYPLWDLAVNGYDKETKMPVIEASVFVEFFGRMVSGERIYAKGWTSIAWGVAVK